MHHCEKPHGVFNASSHEQGVGLTQGLKCLDLAMPLAGLSASFIDELLKDEPVRAREVDGFSSPCRAWNYSRSFNKEGNEFLGRAKCIPSCWEDCWCVCVSSDRGKMLRLLLHGDAGGFVVGFLGVREDEHQMTFQRLVPQYTCPQQPLPASSDVLFLKLDFVCCMEII